MCSERIDIAGIIPHRKPMLMIDSVSLGSATGSTQDGLPGGSPDGSPGSPCGSADRAWVTVRDDCPALDDSGLLIGAAFFEIMAQGFAAINAVRALQAIPSGQNGQAGLEEAVEMPKAGFLVGVKKFACHGSAAPGDELYVSIGKSSALGPFHVFDASVWAAGTGGTASAGGTGNANAGAAANSDGTGNVSNTGSTGHTDSADNDVLLASGQVKIFLLEGDGLPTEALQA